MNRYEWQNQQTNIIRFLPSELVINLSLNFTMLHNLHIIHLVFSLYLRACRSERVFFDPFISCIGPRISHRDGLPLAYSEETYNNALALCSVAHGAPQNAGCSCTTAGGPVHCDESVADPTLFNARLDGRTTTIAEYCAIIGCYCRRFTEAQVISYRTRLAFASSTTSSLRPSRVANPSYEPTGANPFRGIAGAAQNGDGCGVGCKSDEDCQSCAVDQNTAESYNCRAAQQSQFNPTTGAATFLSMCLISASTTALDGKSNGNGGKRDVEFPCPCNTTYVSHGCCGAKGGLIWEPLGFNLGKLVSGDES